MSEGLVIPPSRTLHSLIYVLVGTVRGYYASIYAPVRVQVRAVVHTCKCTGVHACGCAHVHGCTWACAHGERVHLRTSTCVHVCKNACVRVCVHAWVHTCVFACGHTHHRMPTHYTLPTHQLPAGHAPLCLGARGSYVTTINTSTMRECVLIRMRTY